MAAAEKTIGGIDVRRLCYFGAHIAGLLVPDAWCRMRLGSRLGRLEDFDIAHIRDRVRYYNKLNRSFSLGAELASVGDFTRFWSWRKQRAYHFDLHQHLRYFPARLRFAYRFGDNTREPGIPTLIKARPVAPGNENFVLCKLNRLRHFRFVRDPVRFEDKRDLLVWRGAVNRPHRREFLRRFHNHRLCDVGQTGGRETDVPWRRPYMSIDEQLGYKFVLSIEGNDVASNLKWILSSNSLCFMTRPRFETWFMEGRLIPNYHYVLLRDDYSDLEEKILYYSRHTDEARQILRNANRHVAQFRDTNREALISLYVLIKYFVLSGQQPLLEPPPFLADALQAVS